MTPGVDGTNTFVRVPKRVNILEGGSMLRLQSDTLGLFGEHARNAAPTRDKVFEQRTLAPIFISAVEQVDVKGVWLAVVAILNSPGGEENVTGFDQLDTRPASHDLHITQVVESQFGIPPNSVPLLLIIIGSLSAPIHDDLGVRAPGRILEVEPAHL